MSVWFVESHHINVKVGDCAIHLLLKSGIPPLEVHAAVLIDGGTASRKIPGLDVIAVSYDSPITRMVTFFNKSGRYKFPNATNTLQFDTIVMSHWDEDHHGGLVNTLIEDAQAAINSGTNISYLKWSTASPPQPLTVFYCPNVKSTKGSGANKLNGLPGRLSRTPGPPELIQVAVPIKSKKVNYPFAQVKYADGAYDATTNPHPVWNVLGVNFFNNVKSNNPGDPAKPQDLLKNNPPNSTQPADGRPGMYCIGVLETTFDLPGIVGIVPSSGVTKTNRVSIAAAIMWPSKVNADSPPRCSHYFAGDLEDNFEQKVVNWLIKGGIERFTSMKLSHHGSHSSTPMNLVTGMLGNLAPMNIIASNPNGGYFHPAWEIVLVVGIWARLAQNNKRSPRLWATKYPFYLSQDDSGTYTNVAVTKKVKVKVNMKAFESATGPFVQWLQNQYQSMLMGGSGANSEYAKWAAAQKNGDNLSLLIMNFVKAYWEFCCFPGPMSMPATGSATIKPDLAKPTDSGLEESVIVVSVDDDAADGLMYRKAYNQWRLRPMNRINPSNATASTASVTGKTKQMTIGPSTDPFTVPNKKPRLKQLDETAPLPDLTDHELVTSSRNAANAFDPGVGTNPDEIDWDDENAYAGDDDLDAPALAPQGLPIIPDDPSDSNPAAAWYIYSTATSSSVITPVTQDYSQTANTSSWDGIISTLHSAVLALTKDPTKTSPGEVVPVDPSDEWGAWLKDCVGAQGLSMITSGVSTDANIGAFEFITQLPPINPVESSSSSTTPPTLTFTTDEAVLTNTFSPATPPPFGIRDGSTALIFGLDASKTPPGNTVTISELIAWVGLNDLLSDKFIAAIIGPMTLNLPTSSDAAKGRRNAIWFQPQAAYKTTSRLEFDLSDDAKSSLNSVFSILGTFKINSASLIARRSSIWTSGATSVVVQSIGSLALTAEFEFSSYDIVFDVNFELNQSSIVVELVLQSTTSKILDWLGSALGIPSDAFDFTKWLSGTAGSVQLPSFDFRRVQLEFSSDPNTGKLSFTSLTLDMELKVTCNKQNLLFLLTYKYLAGSGAASGSSLEADLWTAPIFNPDDLDLRLLPDFENYAFFKPLTVTDWSNWPSFLDLGQLAGFDNVPKEIPTLVTQAKLLIGSGGVAFTAVIRADQAASTPVPVISLDEIDLAMSYQFNTTGTSGFAASLGVHVFLQANPIADPQYAGPAQILGSIDYSSAGWTLTGSVSNLWASTLYQFFNSDIQSAIAPVLQSILIDSVDVTYKYDAAGKASSLDLAAQLHFGSVELDLKYNNQPSEDGQGSVWTFSAEADLTVNKGRKITLGDVLNGLIGTTGDLPDFVTGVEIELSSETDFIKLDMQSLPSGTPGLFFTAAVQIATAITTFTFQYIQYCTTDAANKKLPYKRVFVASMSSFPTFDVPLIGKIPQPFDEALFMWVQPQTGSDGLTKADVDIINQMLTTDSLQNLPFKPVKKDPQPTDVLIKNGMHFMLVLKSNSGTPNVALDYTFGASTPKTDSPDATDGAETTTDDNTSDDSAKDGNSGMVEYQKTVGGLSVRNLGLSYSKSVLSVKLDASIALGPVAFSLLGAAIKVDFSKDGGSLSNVTFDMLSFSIDGMAAAFDRPPLLMAGMFEVINTSAVHGYQGAVSIAFQPWMFAAAGFYGTMTDPEYTTAFVYAILNGPLITLEFAQITGITGGFGYNTNLKLPSAAAVPQFPFISPPPSSGSPQDDLAKLTGTGWFFPQQDCFWVAAGLTVEAFELLSIQAVIVVEWDPSVKLGLYGLATADIPASIGGSGRSFAHVQLGLAATIDFGAGTMKIDGQLTPASYILDPSCHLVGGFALYSWFGNADPSLRGDWVFTIGGYHQKFIAPPQYPNPPRLGISWQFNDNISISGLSYFAITPKVCMGGGRLDVTLSLGPLSAFLDAYIDFLINFKPFHFIADGGISVGVRFTLDLWLVTIHISVEISCQLYIEGPPIHGTVHVDFWVFGFDIGFGQQSDPSPALTLDEFIQLVCSLSQPLEAAVTTITAQTSIQAAGDDPTPIENGKLHVFSVTDGLAPSGDSTSQPSGGVWLVRAATFAFMVSCKFAADSITVQTGVISGDPEDPIVINGTGNAIHAKPMRENSVTSSVTVTITPDAPPKKAMNSLTHADLDDIVPVWDHVSGITKSLPNGLWGFYDPNADPSSNANNQDLLDGTKDGTTSFLTGVTITHPDPAISRDDTTKPFDYIVMNVSNADTVKFPDPLPMEPTFEAEQPDTTGKQWADVASKWATPSGPVSSVDFVNLWTEIGTSILGWDPENVSRKGGDNTLTGEAPTQELLKNIDGYLLWAPMMTAAAASA
ncbi:hypothetical protein TWF694_005834 [Orbilia ellipsospora]|uniref:DUF6603 domain-containing protein n=1 Tax=Orbilia ellipsospora TaxID=2528407 RepID=A0AAV9WU78_9PEZI